MRRIGSGCGANKKAQMVWTRTMSIILALFLLALIGLLLYQFYIKKAIPGFSYIPGLNSTQPRATGVHILGYSFVYGIMYYDGNKWVSMGPNSGIVFQDATIPYSPNLVGSFVNDWAVAIAKSGKIPTLYKLTEDDIKSLDRKYDANKPYFIRDEGIYDPVVQGGSSNGPKQAQNKALYWLSLVNSEGIKEADMAFVFSPETIFYRDFTRDPKGTGEVFDTLDDYKIILNLKFYFINNFIDWNTMGFSNRLLKTPIKISFTDKNNKAVSLHFCAKLDQSKWIYYIDLNKPVSPSKLFNGRC